MIGRRATAATLALAGSLLLGACSSEADSTESGAGSAQPQIKVAGAFVPEPVNDKMAGGFLTLTNAGDEADTLRTVTSEVSDDVQLHETVDNKMRRVESLEVPANGELKLARGGTHLMFMDLKKKLTEGDTVKVELEFEKADPVTVDMPVEAGTHDPHSGH